MRTAPLCLCFDLRATVLNLDTFLDDRVSGPVFFDEIFFTNAVLAMVDRALRHLGGSGACSSVFSFSQAMSGGKTHRLIALGQLARDPELRARILGSQGPSPVLGACRVLGFNGRTADAAPSSSITRGQMYHLPRLQPSGPHLAPNQQTALPVQHRRHRRYGRLLPCASTTAN